MLFNWGIEGVNYEMVDGKPVRSAEEIAKATSDPDYAKKTGIENYPGFPRYGEGAVDENGIPYTRYTKERNMKQTFKCNSTTAIVKTCS